MALAVVQHNAAIHSQSVPGAVTLGSAPTVGNLLIALVGCNINPASITIGAGWTLFDQVNIETGTQAVMTALYRYVQGGDTATLPAFWSAGSTYWSHQVWEVSGVSGTWTTDFLSSVPLWGAESNTALPQFPIFAAGLALSGTASYNGNSNPSITGTWTLDDTNNNNSNFGSAAGAHRVVANGDTIDGTWTQGTSAPFGGILILLTTQQPLGGVYPRHVYRTVANGTPGSFTVPWVPNPGNLLIAYLDWKDGTIANPTVGGSWTDWVDATRTTKNILGLYRYVQGGDTAALPALVTSGSTFYVATIIELAGGSGTFGSDHVSDKTGTQASGATLTTTADATTANNQFALLNFANYSGAALSSTTGFTNYVEDGLNNGAYGSWFTAFKFFPTSGTTVQGTITPGSSAQPQAYIQSIFNQGTGSISDSVNLVAATASGAAAGATPSGQETLSGASSAGAAAAVTPQVSVAPSAASASGAVNIVSGGQGVGVSPATGTAAAAAVVPKVSPATLAPASAAGAVHALSFSDTSFANPAAAAGAAAAVAASLSLRLSPAITYPAAAPILFGQQIPFPVFSLMRDTPVACIGSMADTPIALIGRMPPSGPEPLGVEVFLAAVSARAHAATITPFFDVKVSLAAAIAHGAAAPVVAA